MPYGRNVVISRLWFLSPYALRLTIHGNILTLCYAVGSGIKLDWMIFDICIPNSAFGNPHLVGSRTIES